ncbi:MAG: PTS sugar transporter subunit IIA [Bacillota bacterium]
MTELRESGGVRQEPRASSLPLRLADLIRPEYLRVMDSAADRESAVRVLADALLANGAVHPDFGIRVLEREREFPTGLPTPGVKVALPHTDAQWVNESAVAVGILHRPVTFHVMGDPSNTVDVQVIFLLAIQQQDKQAEMLSQVVELVQDVAFLEGLVAASSGGQAYQLIQHRLGPGPTP